MSSKKLWSNYQETGVAQALGWKVVPGSGSRHLYPGDVSSANWLGECTTHVYDNYTIQFNCRVWQKICNEARSRFKQPVLFVDDGSHLLDRTWAMFSTTVGLPEGTIISEYPYNIRKNIVFSGGELGNRIINNSGDGRAIVYRILDWEHSSVYVCKFRYFVDMFGEV